VILTPVAAMLTFAIIAALAAVVWHRFGVRARPALVPAVEALEVFLAQRNDFLAKHSYARGSHRQRLVEAGIRALDSTRTVSWFLFANSVQRKTAAAVSRFVSDSESLVAQANDAFVQSEMAKFREFFDTVESKPLTPAQRRSCVVGEDNNLVLAGAGTGKTSTMIGRAGYLLASNRARPDELLMLAFGKKAAGEMQERQNSRLKRWIDDDAPTIKTFHALGLQIIGAVEGRRPDITPMAEDDYSLAKFIDAEIAECCDEPLYKAMIVRYCGSERYPYRNPFDFDSMQEYNEYVRANELRTLKGEVVKSFEECVIANFLSANSVSYKYEHPYKVDTSGPDFRQYKPDFYLPDHDVYIEHFALDRKGQPPPHFDKKKYLEGIRWKRDLHQKHDTKLVQTYSYLKREGNLESHLAQQLRAKGVELRPKSNDELLEELRKSSEVAEFAILMAKILTLFKESDHHLDALRNKAAQHIDSTRLLLLFDLFTPILVAYEAELAEFGQIDFADMIRKATEHVESGRYQSPYLHVLVDEFQDISRARARLVSAFVGQRPESFLFVVGDDWQSIYRFTGSDIAYTRDFRDIFGNTATIPLDLTFRFNDQIGNAASKFILKNPAQIVKSIRSLHEAPHPAFSFIRVVRTEDGLKMALDAIEKQSGYGHDSKATVLVLGRYNFVIEDWWSPAASRQLKTMHPSLDVQFMTVHGAKGKEADYVVVLGLGRGKNGFPCEKPTDSVLEFLLPDLEPFPLAEERRLFYVALTRARRRVYLAYNPLEASQFVLELLNKEEGYSVCTDEFASRLMCAEIAFVPCPDCATGALVPRTGPDGFSFVGCNNYPYCKHTEKPCPQCGSLLRRSARSRECTNQACNAVVPICSKCGGDMVERSGPYGKFWGCTNYRRNAGFICTHTMNISSQRRPLPTDKRSRQPHPPLGHKPPRYPRRWK